MRPSGRDVAQLREIKLTCGYTKHAEGSVLIEFGDTKVLCNASVDKSVPRFLKGKGEEATEESYPYCSASCGGCVPLAWGKTYSFRSLKAMP